MILKFVLPLGNRQWTRWCLLLSIYVYIVLCPILKSCTDSYKLNMFFKGCIPSSFRVQYEFVCVVNSEGSKRISHWKHITKVIWRRQLDELLCWLSNLFCFVKKSLICSLIALIATSTQPKSLLFRVKVLNLLLDCL